MLDSQQLGVISSGSRVRSPVSHTLKLRSVPACAFRHALNAGRYKGVPGKAGSGSAGNELGIVRMKSLTAQGFNSPQLHHSSLQQYLLLLGRRMPFEALAKNGCMSYLLLELRMARQLAYVLRLHPQKRQFPKTDLQRFYTEPPQPS